jgi:hypothetical protein
MKREYKLLAFALLACIGASAVPCEAQTVSGPNASLKSITLDVRPDRASYVLGELVTLEIVARNRSARPIAIPGLEVWDGRVGVMIASGDGPFREYRGPGWGLHDVAAGEPITLRARQSVKGEATVLYNHGTESRHLNREASATITTRYMEEGYAFAVPGTYRIKAVLYAQGFDDVVESEPAQILVEQPAAADLEVWNVLRTNGHLGYFIQAGSPRARSTPETRQRLVDTLERLATDYPDSRHADRVRERLTTYRDMLADLTVRGIVVR